MDWLFSIVMGLVEGVTEFLPISSTGHLILTSELFNRPDNTAFEVGIQIGAITAIAVLYWRRLWDALRTVFAGAREGSGVNLLWLIVAAPTLAEQHLRPPPSGVSVAATPAA